MTGDTQNFGPDRLESQQVARPSCTASLADPGSPGIPIQATETQGSESPIWLDFGGHVLRILMKDGEPWFVAAEVCTVLDIANHRDAVSKLDDDEKGVGLTDTLGGTQETTIINESGLYTLILRCRDAVRAGNHRAPIPQVGDP